MMRVLIDTNIILDQLMAREPFLSDASKLFRLCEAKKIQGFVSSLSLANIIYIMRKELTQDKISDIINKLFLIFKITDLYADDLKKAAVLPFYDFEDSLQCVCAINVHAEYIITRNKKDFAHSSVPALLPCEFFAIIS